MEPIEALRQDAFAAYISQYANAEPSNIPYILRYWNEAKANWFHLFGDKLTIEKPIFYTEDEKETRDRIAEFTWESKDYADIYSAITSKYPLENLYILLSTGTLAKNRYNGPTFTVDTIKVQNGCKPLPTIHKILRQLDYPEESFERFRIAHSQILNTTRIYGTLVLSIDPLDYITMSDNSLGWDSCMCWADHTGEYRGGTIEMMNSPDVLIAYIKSNESYYPCDDDTPFSNKKWRQLVIATSDIILGNRHYPYYCPEAEAEALRWVSSLLGAEHFSDKIVPIHNHKNNDGIYISINTNVMYNDIYDSRNAILPKEPHDVDINISGPRVCMNCGDVIDTSDPSDWVVCHDCNNSKQCDYCGEWANEENGYTNSNGDFFCRCCIENGDISLCSNCDEFYPNDDMTEYSFDFAPADSICTDTRYACLCPNCNPSFGFFGETNHYGDYQYEDCSPEAQKFIDGLNI